MKNTNNKDNKELFNICSTGESRLHSRNGLFETILKDQPPEVLKLKQDIIRLSYSIKSLGLQNGEIGILSKRMPLRLKQKPMVKENTITPSEVFNKPYVTHSSFYSAPLHVVKRQNPSAEKDNRPAGIILNPEGEGFSQSIEAPKPFTIKPSKSTNNIHLKRQKSEPAKNILQLSRVTRSYSQLLNEINSKKTIKLQPIGENRLMERIRKLSNLTKVQLTTGENAKKTAYIKNL